MNSNSITADEFQAHIQAMKGAGKVKTRLQPAKSKPKPDTMTADQFRVDHVDTNEHDLQKLCVEWFRSQFPMVLIAAVPNAAKRSPQLAQMMIDEGMLAGFPDLIVAYPNQEYHGLYIEMKTRKGKISDEQAKIGAYLRAVGYAVEYPRTFEGFQTAVNDYMNRARFKNLPNSIL